MRYTHKYIESKSRNLTCIQHSPNSNPPWLVVFLRERTRIFSTIRFPKFFVVVVASVALLSSCHFHCRYFCRLTFFLFHFYFFCYFSFFCARNTSSRYPLWRDSRTFRALFVLCNFFNVILPCPAWHISDYFCLSKWIFMNGVCVCVFVLYTSKHTKHSHTHVRARAHSYTRKKDCGFFGYLSIFVYVVAPFSKWHLVKLLEQSKFSIIYVWRRIKMEGRKQPNRKKTKHRKEWGRVRAGEWVKR